MVAIYYTLRERNLLDDIQMCNQVHDDLLFYVREGHEETAKKLVKKGLETAWALKLPLVTEPVVGDTWKSLK